MIHTGPSSDSVSLQEEVHKSIVGKDSSAERVLDALPHLAPCSIIGISLVGVSTAMPSS